MKVCIIGAGAIGGFIGTRLAAAGQAQVSAIARGATLAALREHGWRMRYQGELLQAPALASDSPTELGVQDLLIIAVKAPALASVARQIVPLMGPQTVVLPAMNGVPWWFSIGIPALGEAPLQSVDPGGEIARRIPFEQVLGAVVHASTSLEEPGLVLHNTGDRLIIGEPRGGSSPRVEQVAALLTKAGFEVPCSTHIRREVWYKLWGNLTMNPVSALTGGTIEQMLGDPLVRDFCSKVMREAAVIGAGMGCPIDEDPEQRHALAAKLGAFKTSMLQDVEAQRPLELDAIVGAVYELGRRLGVDTPHIDALFGLSRLFGQVRGLYPQA